MAPFGFLPIIFIIHSCVGQNSPFWEEGVKSHNIIAKEDAVESIKKLEPYWRSFGHNWVVMPDSDGETRGVLVHERKAMDKGKTFNFDKMDEKIKFYLYNRENPSGVLFTKSTLENLKIDSSLPTRIISHGWMADSNSTITQYIKDAYMAIDGNNVIAVDWQYFSHDPAYVLAVKAVKHVGKHIGRMIDDLVMHKGVNYKDVHIIGHSLGAHTAGFAGASTREKIGRITGLDPALPGFGVITDGRGRLDDTDALFVDIIHTCSGFLGVSAPIGHIDFYPNGGSTCQPGCKSDSPVLGATEACSHSRSFEYFIESVNPNSEFIAVKCEDWHHFKERKCENVYQNMGHYASKNVTGIFYLKTHGIAPFAMGINGTIY